jgi:hypothetical protein
MFVPTGLGALDWRSNPADEMSRPRRLTVPREPAIIT